MQSLTAHYAKVVRSTFKSADRWTWPTDRSAEQSSPDMRLMSYNLSNTFANVTLPNGRMIRCGIRAVTSHDLLLTCDDEVLLPLLGQAVEISVLSQGREVASVTTILHWCGDIYSELVVAGFTVEALPDTLVNRDQKCGRGQIRFPLEMQAVVSVSPEKEVLGTIADYSLSGCRFIAEEQIDLDRDYPMTVLMDTAAVEMTLHPRWVLNTINGFQLGCSLQSEQGVLLACRHHPNQTGFSYPLQPVTQNWNQTASSDDDFGDEVEASW